MLRRGGLRINHKKVHRLYVEEGLQLKPRRRRRRAATVRQPRAVVTQPNERWAMDFMHDVLATGQHVRVFTLVDVYTRECVALEVARSFSGSHVARMLSDAGERLGALPPIVQCDNGTELTSTALDHWAYWNRVQLDFSRPGKPVDNSVCEAFNGSLRRECLTRHWFASLAEARVVLTSWRENYNNTGPIRAWGSNHQPSSEVLVSTCLALELSKSDALTRTYFGDPGPTAGDPTTVAWAQTQQAKHVITNNLTLRFDRLGVLQLFGRIQSGIPFTPFVRGDINGDGYSNDRAFIFNPSNTLSSPIHRSTRCEKLGQTFLTSRDSIAGQVAKFLVARNGDYGGGAVREVWHAAGIESYRVYIRTMKNFLALLTPQQIERSKSIPQMIGLVQTFSTIKESDLPYMFRNARLTLP
jgi:putative transposase